MKYLLNHKIVIICMLVIVLTAFLLLITNSDRRELKATGLPNPELRKMENANAENDFREAITNHDLRFVGMMGYSLIIPGVEDLEKYRLYRKHFGVRVIEGTSDVIISEEHRHLQGLAYNYALQYNKLLIIFIDGHPELIKNNIEQQ